MSVIPKQPFERVSFSRQFLLAGAVILVIALASVGTWLARQIEGSAITRAATIAAVYVESILATQLQDWAANGVVSTATHETFDRVFVNGPLRRKVVRFKLWDAEGRIVYSSDHGQVGHQFPVAGRLAAAFAGAVQARISDLRAEDNLPERERWPQLLEVYVPVRTSEDGRIVAVAEFYHSMENLGREIRSTQRHSWLLLTLTALGIFAALYGLVRRANDTIVAQQRSRREQLQQMRSTLADNERMREQLQEAGAQTTALNEQFLHRIAADLHDGPAQDLAFSLLRFDEMVRTCAGCERSQEKPAQDLHAVHGALSSSLTELRAIASGLGVPGIDALSLADTVRRAVRDVERKAGCQIAAEIDAALNEKIDENPDEKSGDAPLATRITVYRVVQESLTNALRHAPGHPPQLRARLDGNAVSVEVIDQGAGFDTTAPSSGRLGLSFMRERVRLLGGAIEIDSAPGRGTRIHARIPLSPEEVNHV